MKIRKMEDGRRKILIVLLFFLILSSLLTTLHSSLITLEGEVIGKPMKRGKCYLVNINDATSTIGVFVKKLPEITYYGKYGVLGDRVRIVGGKNYACKEHWGKRDIHADTLEVLDKGRLQEKPISKDRISLLFALSLITLLLIIVHRRLETFLKKQKSREPV